MSCMPDGCKARKREDNQTLRRKTFNKKIDKQEVLLYEGCSMGMWG